MKINKLLFSVISCLIIFQACDKTTEFNFEYPDSKLVINSLVNVDSLCKVYLSESLTPTDVINFKDVKDANIELFQNGISIGILNNFVKTDQNPGLGYYTNPDIRINPNDSINITVSHNNYENMYAETFIPQKPVANVTVLSQHVEEVITMPGFDYYASVELYFGENLAPENYYAINFYYYAQFSDFPYKDTTFVEKISFEISSENAFRTYKLNDGYIISAKNINDSTNNYLLNISHLLKINNTDSTKIYIEIKSISKDYYLYQKTLKEYYLAIQNPFSESLKVYSNINNGYGIFAGYNSIIDTLSLSQNLSRKNN